MSKTVKVTYNADTLETTIVVDGKKFDTSRINGMEIADWAYPFMVRKVRWNGFYDEMVQALGGQKAFDLVFEGSEESLAELKEAWEDAPINVVSGSGGNFVVITYDANALTTEITVNGQTFDTSRINGKEIEDWIYPFMMRKVKWNGIFDELKKALGTAEYDIQFSGTRAAMMALMEECPDEVEICKIKDEKNNEATKKYDKTDVDIESEIQRIVDSVWDDFAHRNEKHKEFQKMLEYAKSGNARAQYELSEFYANGIGTEQNDKKEYEWCLEAANNGNANAQCNLADWYFYGDGIIEIDYIEAVKWYKKAAEQGDKDGCQGLGICYHLGFGISQNNDKAFKYLSKADDDLGILGHYYLGCCYYNGEGTAIDYKKAFHHFEEASSINIDAQFMLGVLHFTGAGVTEDIYEAVSLFQASAEEGCSGAQYALGLCYFNGHGVQQDYYEAANWFKQAYENKPDDEYINYYLGLCYIQGKGVPKDKNKGMQYIQAASENGCAEATSLLNNKQLMRKIYENIDGVLDVAGMIPVPQIQTVVGGLKAVKGITDRFVNNTNEE